VLQPGTNSVLDELHRSLARAQGHLSSLIDPDLQTRDAPRQNLADNGEHLPPKTTRHRVAGARWSRPAPSVQRRHAGVLVPNRAAARSKEGAHGIVELPASEASSSSLPLSPEERHHHPQMNYSNAASQSFTYDPWASYTSIANAVSTPGPHAVCDQDVPMKMAVANQQEQELAFLVRHFTETIGPW
jgi:hypothetical protein